jgi:acyl carrier protein
VLAAWVVAPGQTSGTPSQLRSYLAKRLPAVAVPAVLTMVEWIPVTANGKIDWAALPAAVPEAAATAYAAPRTALERTVSTVMATLLRREQVGVHDRFFDLGGHSLLAMQLVSRLATATGVSLPLQVVFESQTPAELAAVIEERRTGGAESA